MKWPRHTTPVLLTSLLAAAPLAAKTPAIASSAFEAALIRRNVSRNPTNESFGRAQSPQSAPPPNLRLPDEAAGLDGIVRTLISAFDQADVVALGEEHGEKLDSDVRIALLRHPDFAKKVRFIVVEFASTAQQPTLDRYIRGETVPIAALEQVWKTTTQSRSGVWDSPIYADFLAAVRDVNTPAGSVMTRDASAISVLKQQVLEKHGKALVIYGAAHFYRTEVNQILTANGGGITKLLQADYPGRAFVVMPVGGHGPEFQEFEGALMTAVRPVLVSLQRPPFRDFTAEEFIGRKMLNCLGAKSVPDGCVSGFQGSGVTLGQLADACIYWRSGADDACIYWRSGADADTKAKPGR